MRRAITDYVSSPTNPKENKDGVIVIIGDNDKPRVLRYDRRSYIKYNT